MVHRGLPAPPRAPRRRAARTRSSSGHARSVRKRLRCRRSRGSSRRSTKPMSSSRSSKRANVIGSMSRIPASPAWLMPSQLAMLASTCHCARLSPMPAARARCSSRLRSRRATSWTRKPSVGSLQLGRSAGMAILSAAMISLLMIYLPTGERQALPHGEASTTVQGSHARIALPDGLRPRPQPVTTARRPLAYRPRQTGLRFSAKARAPSSWSSLS